MTECNQRIRGVIICDQFTLRIDPSAKGGGQGMASPLRAGGTLAVDRLDQIFRDLIDALPLQTVVHAVAKCRNPQ
jgi:hypothetical protein